MASFNSAFTGVQIDAALTKANSATQPGDLGTAATTDATDYATAAQGELADSATQPGDLATVATSNEYDDLTGLPTLGTAAATATTDYATAAQGELADSATQPGDLATVATSGDYADLTGVPTAISDTTAAFTTVQANAIIANTAKVTNATHTGDATGGTALTVTGINGTSLAGLATGLLKNTTSTGVPSIASNSDLPTMTATVGGAVPTPPNNTTTFLRGDGTFAEPPSGGGGGSITSVTGTAPIASSGGDTPAISIIPATGSVPGSMSAADKTKLDAISGTNTGDQTSIVGITGTKAQFDTAVTDGNILYVGDVTTNATHTGDATGSTALTLATVNNNVGSFGIAASVAQFTVNAKGLITAAANVAISIASTAISDSTTAGRAFLTAATAAAQRTLLNVADGATANASDADLRDRATHTGTQLASTVSDLATAVAATASVTANTSKVTNATHTGDVTGATALTIADGAVTNAKAANMATATIKGRTSAGTGDPEDLTPAQARTVMELGTAATTAATAYATAAQGTLAGTATQPGDIALMVESDVTGVTGADAITNIMRLTQAEYDAIVTPDASTIYAITDA